MSGGQKDLEPGDPYNKQNNLENYQLFILKFTSFFGLQNRKWPVHADGAHHHPLVIPDCRMCMRPCLPKLANRQYPIGGIDILAAPHPFPALQIPLAQSQCQAQESPNDRPEKSALFKSS
jgi:hypothetical protein